MVKMVKKKSKEFTSNKILPREKLSKTIDYGYNDLKQFSYLFKPGNNVRLRQKKFFFLTISNCLSTGSDIMMGKCF